MPPRRTKGTIDQALTAEIDPVHNEEDLTGVLADQEADLTEMVLRNDTAVIPEIDEAWQRENRVGSRPFDEPVEFPEPPAHEEVWPTYPELHREGAGKFDKCNVAEDHALHNPGHSVTVIHTYLDAHDLHGRLVIKVVCFGTPGAYEHGLQNCYFTEFVEIQRPSSEE